MTVANHSRRLGNLKAKLVRAGYSILKMSESSDPFNEDSLGRMMEIRLDYRSRKDFYPEFKNYLTICDIDWDFKSVADYISKKYGIHRKKFFLWGLYPGDLPIYTREFRKTYPIGKFKIKRWPTEKHGSHTVRPCLVDIGHTADYIGEQAKRIIDQKHLKTYQFMLVYRPGSGKFGGVVETGGRI